MPSAEVLAVRVSPVVRFRNVTVAPKTMVPFVSRTTPCMAPDFRAVSPGSCSCCVAAAGIVGAADRGDEAITSSKTSLGNALDAAGILNILKIVGDLGKEFVRD